MLRLWLGRPLGLIVGGLHLAWWDFDTAFEESGAQAFILLGFGQPMLGASHCLGGLGEYGVLSQISPPARTSWLRISIVSRLGLAWRRVWQPRERGPSFRG